MGVQKRIGLANTVEEFKDRTYKKLRTDRLREYANKVEYDVLEKMGERLVDEVPADVVDSVTNQLLMEFDNFLKSYEMDRETYLLTQGTTEEEFLDQVHQDAHDRVSQDIAVAAYAHQTGVTLDDKDINAMFLQPTPEKSFESRQQAERTGEIENIRDLALRAKTAELLTRSAIFLKEDGSQDEEFQKAVKEKYQKLQAVRDHATAAPMVKRPH